MVKLLRLKQYACFLLITVFLGVACNKINHAEKQPKEGIQIDSTQIKEANYRNLKGLISLHADQRDSAIIYFKESLSVDNYIYSTAIPKDFNEIGLISAGVS